MAPRPDNGQNAAELSASRALTEELTEFSSRAGHDMVGPLNQAASLVALFVSRYRNQLDADADALLEHLGNSAKRMDTVVAAVKRYLNVGSRPLEYRSADLRVLLSSALAVLDPAIKGSGAAITVETLPNIACDGERITDVFELLLDNAITFRKPNEVPRIRISADCQKDAILIAVTDNGIGIDLKYAEEVFLPFRRLNGREYPGAGLGLTTAKLIARLHGGSIRVSPESEAGTKMIVSLPVSN